MIALMESDGGIVKAGWRGARLIGRYALDQLFPPVCLACAKAVSTPNGLCAPCWTELVPITAPLCPVLGIPFAAEIGPDALSAQAIADPPPFRRARSAVAYNDIARALVSRMKYADRPEIAHYCAAMMAGAGAEILAGADAVLVPVPLHRMRQFQRRYNQSTELARHLARVANLPVDTNLVSRARNTPQQVGLNARQRARNVSGAFRVDPQGLSRLAGRPIILVDDVITTGATIVALTKALNRAGVHHVDVISFARVVFGTDMTV